MNRKLALLVILMLGAIHSVSFGQGYEIEPEELSFNNIAIGTEGFLENYITFTVSNISDSVLTFEDSDYPNDQPFQLIRSDAVEAYAGIRSILKASGSYVQDRGEDPNSNSELIETGYLELSEDLLSRWSFTLIGNSPITQIEAVSTREMPGGAGRTVLFDLELRRFSEYGYLNGSIDGFELNPGESNEFVAIFIPEDEEDQSGYFTFNPRDGEEQRVNATGTGFYQQLLEVSTDTLDFGNVAIGSSRAIQLTFENISDFFFFFWIDFSDEEYFSCHNILVEPVQVTILNIVEAVDRYNSDNGQDPISVDHLIENGYIEIDDEILDFWNFTFLGRGSITLIEAVTTAEHIMGAGHHILYSIELNRFSGFGNGGGGYIGSEREVTMIFTFYADEEGAYSETRRISCHPDMLLPHQTTTIVLLGNAVDPADVDEEKERILPDTPWLSDAYPNPFNSQTKLSYYLPSATDATLNVYDVTGQLVATVVNGRQSVGQHEAIWNAQAYSAGIYFVRLETNILSATCKLILMK